MRRLLVAVFVLLFISIIARAQDQTVVPITKVKLLGPIAEAKFGSGFCIDPECRFIGTNRHVAALMGGQFKVEGEKVINRYLNPELDPKHDLAVVELRRALSPHYRGLPFGLSDLRVGQPVDIYSYPLEKNPKRKLLKFHGTFVGETQDKVWAFRYEPAGKNKITPGSSGGIIVSDGKIVAILQGIATNEDLVAIAVPAQELVDFLSKCQPFLYTQLFPARITSSPESADLYPRWIPRKQDGLQHRSVEPEDVQLLRRKAQELSASMRDFIAVQTVEYGSQDHDPSAFAQYEVRVVDGYQRFREYPDGKKLYENVPEPPLNTVLMPGGEWAGLPELVGTDLKLRVRRADDASLGGTPIHVFQYVGAVEDHVCAFKWTFDAGFMWHSKTTFYECYGEVWTDENENILRISENDALLDHWKNLHVVVTYGWLHRDNDPPRLIPVTYSQQAEVRSKIYWCRGLFVDYRMFSAKALIGVLFRLPLSLYG